MLNTLPPPHPSSMPPSVPDRLSDADLSRIFSMPIYTFGFLEFKVMFDAANKKSTATVQPDGKRTSPMEFLIEDLSQRFPEMAHAMTEKNLLNLPFSHEQASPAVLKIGLGNDVQDYAVLLVRPPVKPSVIDYMASTCYDYSPEMMTGAEAGKIELWHELQTLLRAGACMGVENNLFQPTLPEFFQVPSWKCDAVALKAFMGRAKNDADYADRKLIVNQFYGVKALVTVGNTYSGAYEAQLLKRLDHPDFNDDMIAAFKKARNELVYDFLSRRTHWGQNMGECFIIMHEDAVAPMYLALKDGLKTNHIADEMQREIAQDFVTGAEMLFPEKMLKASGPVGAFQCAAKAILPTPRDVPLIQAEGRGARLLSAVRAMIPFMK